MKTLRHIFFEMEDGSNIAFFECPKDPGNMKDLESPDWIQHFAFEVESVDVPPSPKFHW